MKTSRAVLCGLAVVVMPTAIQAQQFNTGPQTAVSCDPSMFNGLLQPGSTASCQADGGTTQAIAQVTPTSLKAKLAVGAGARTGGYFSGAVILDSLIVSAKNSIYDQSDGSLSFTYAFDGTIGGNGSSVMSLGVERFIYDPQSSSYSPVFGAVSGSADYIIPQTGASGRINLVASQNRGFPGDIEINYIRGSTARYEGLVNFTFGITFGDYFNYLTELEEFAFQPGANVDFFNTAQLNSITARDLNGRIVDVTISSASGTDYTPFLPAPTSAVPEPISWSMLLIGFVAIGGNLRVRDRKSILAEALR